MKYMLLIYDDPSIPSPGRGTPEGDERSAQWGVHTQQLIDDGVFVAGDALQPTDSATTVRVRGGERWSPTARSPRPRSGWPATTSSTSPTSTRRLE